MSCNKGPQPTQPGPEPSSKGLGIASSCVVIAISLAVCWIWPEGIISILLVGPPFSILLQAQIKAWIVRQRRSLGLSAEEPNRPEPFTGRFSLLELIAIVMVAFLVIGLVFAPMLTGSADQMTTVQDDAWRCLFAMVIVGLVGWTIRCLRRRDWRGAVLAGLSTLFFPVVILCVSAIRIVVLVGWLALFGLDGIFMHRRWLAWVRAARMGPDPAGTDSSSQSSS